MALAAGLGAVVSLDAVPLKEQGLEPWEIWVSESQERMMLAVRGDDLPRVLDIFADWDVEACVVGQAVPGNRVQVTYRGVVVLDLDLGWYTGGPVYHRPQRAPRPKTAQRRPQAPATLEAANGLLLRMLAHPNVCSREWIVRQYDFDVRARTVVKPFVGIPFTEGPSDASVIKPLEDDARALAIATASAPKACAADPYRGGKLVVDEVVRNLAAAGARPLAITDCLNFGNPENPQRMGELAEVVRGMAEVCRALRVPVPSGNVSLYNESTTGSVPPTAALVGVGTITYVRRAVTTDLKRKGNPLYLVGGVKDQLGASLYYELTGATGGPVPDCNPAALRLGAENMELAASRGMLAAAHDVSDGGLATALAEMAIGGGVGATVDADAARGNLRWDLGLFSESPSRWVVEVERRRAKAFENVMDPVPARRIGTVGGDALLIERGAGAAVDLPVADLRDAWTAPLWRALG